MRGGLRLVLVTVAALLVSACSGGTQSGAGAPLSADAPDGTVESTAAAPVEGSEEAGVSENGTEGAAVSGASTELATFGAGCFWCVEAVLEQLDGVLDVTSGYMGGDVENPTYEQVCRGTTGHAEVVQVTFDPAVVPYATLLDWFWRLHDPTTLNRQGADVGTQYRSAIFTHSETQREAALRSREAAQASFADPIVTEISPASTYYPAEDGHQDYYRLNTGQGYCRVVIAPKLRKLGLDDHTGE